MRSSPTADPLAYERLVDRLLASPHYGERMALGWLDAARYADSNGFQQDGDTWQWIWRDWVVRAINQDLPFDQFTTWQLAGDLLPEATVDQKIASAFNRNHLLNGEGGAIAEEQRFVNLFDRVDTTATTWLGLTMACAQCHDHKFDPITQRDYYGLLDAFNRVPETGTPQCRFITNSRRNRRISKSPPKHTRRALLSLMRRSWRPNTIRSSPLTPPLKAGERESPPMASPLRERAFPTLWPRFCANPTPSARATKGRRSTRGLRKHFDDKVRPGLAVKLPAIAEIGGSRNSWPTTRPTSCRASW